MRRGKSEPGRGGGEAGRPRLTRAEIEVMRVVWDRGRATVGEVLEAVNLRRAKPVTRNTVLVQIQRLEEKGWLERDGARRGSGFRAAVGQAEAEAEMARDFERAVFGGSTASLVRCLVEDGDLDATELAEIRAIIDKAARRSKP